MDCVFTFAPLFVYFFFFFNDTATTEIYTLSLHDALPISITSATRARILKSAVYSGIPVAIVGRGNNEGFTAPQAVFIGGGGIAAGNMLLADRGPSVWCCQAPPAPPPQPSPAYEAKGGAHM